MNKELVEVIEAKYRRVIGLSLWMLLISIILFVKPLIILWVGSLIRQLIYPLNIWKQSIKKEDLSGKAKLFVYSILPYYSVLTYVISVLIISFTPLKSFGVNEGLPATYLFLLWSITTGFINTWVNKLLKLNNNKNKLFYKLRNFSYLLEYIPMLLLTVIILNLIQ